MIEANDPRPRLLAWWDCAVHAHRRLADPSVIGRDAYLATCSALIAQEQIEHLGESIYGVELNSPINVARGA